MIAYMKNAESKASFGFETTVPFDCKESPLWFHDQGLQQTATGYGNRLATPYMIMVRGKWRRVYCCQYSNVGTLYIGKPGAWEYIVENIVKDS